MGHYMCAITYCSGLFGSARAVVAFSLVVAGCSGTDPAPGHVEDVGQVQLAAAFGQYITAFVADAAGGQQTEAVLDFSNISNFDATMTVAFNDKWPDSFTRGSLLGYVHINQATSTYKYSRLFPPAGVDALWGDPAIVTHPKDNAYVYIQSMAVSDLIVGANDRTCIARSTNRGLSFSLSDTDCYPTPAGENNDGSSIAAAKSGDVAFAYRNFTTNKINMWRANSPTGRFREMTAPPFMNLDVRAHPRLAYDENSVLHAVTAYWDNSFGMSLAYARAPNGTFQAPVRLGAYNVLDANYTIPATGNSFRIGGIAYSIAAGRNESGNVEVRIASLYSDGTYFHVRVWRCQNGICSGGSNGVNSWDSARTPGIHHELFPAIAYGGGQWRLAYLTTFYTDASHFWPASHQIEGDGSAAHPYVTHTMQQATGPFRPVTPCPTGGYWSDYYDLKFNSSYPGVLFHYTYADQDVGQEDCNTYPNPHLWLASIGP